MEEFQQPPLSMTPQMYAQCYNVLPQEQKQYYCTPQVYQHYITYYQSYYSTPYPAYSLSPIGSYPVMAPSFPSASPSVPSLACEKPTKLSRNQKRKQKKQALEQQYRKQEKQLGKWVQLERKDLVEGLRKIQEHQEKVKTKRKEKLSHLIEIHKQVYKHMLKKNKGKAGKVEGGANFRRKKKKPSHIKRMKELYQQLRDKAKPIPQTPSQLTNQNKEGQEEDNDYVTDSQNEEEQVSPPQPLPSQLLPPTSNNPCPQTIEYQRISRLAGQTWNNITLRQWMDHMPSVQLEDKVLRLINRLAYKQAIKRIHQPEKAKKLIIAGVHECRRTLWTKLDNKRSKLLILCLNVECNNLEKGTDDQIQQLLRFADEAKVPVLHASTRAKIGRAYTGKFGPRVTVVSVVNCEGYQDMMDDVLDEWRKAKELFLNGALL